MLIPNIIFILLENKSLVVKIPKCESILEHFAADVEEIDFLSRGTIQSTSNTSFFCTGMVVRTNETKSVYVLLVET